MKAITRLAWLALAAAPLVHAQIGGAGGGRGGAGGVGGTGGFGARQYLNNTYIGDALIEVDPETRSIIVITDEDTNKNIGDLVKALDRPKPQVLINVVFMEVTHRDGLDIGIDGKFKYQQNGGDAETGTNFDIVNAFTNPGGGFFSLSGADYEIYLNAYLENGQTEVLSRPTILARNNQEAVITIGQEVPFIRNSRITDQGDQINTVEYEDIGIILRVTPFITSDGLVEMIVAPEISTITDQTVPISAGIEAPVFAKRSAETVVVTPDKKTVVIGGLIEDNKTEQVRKVPLLGDIPILGHAFRRTVKTDTKTELLIFLTPHIIHQPKDLAAISAEEREKLAFANEAFNDADLDRLVGTMDEAELRDYIKSLETRLPTDSEE